MKTEGGYLIGHIKYLSGRRLNKLFSESGLNEFNGEQGKILYQLWKKEGISSKDIASKTGLAINTLTNMLDKMEASGLIFRIQCNKDKRKKCVFLTPKGKALEAKSQAASKKMAEIFYKGFTNEEIEIFENSLRKIITNLEDKKDDK